MTSRVDGFVTGDWIARFEARSLDDVHALGRNSPEDDRAFAAVARMSELNLSAYRTLIQPWVRSLANQQFAAVARALHPLRLSFTMFADGNPWMKGVRKLAAEAAAARRPVTADNPFLALQNRVSDQITARPGCLSRGPRRKWRNRCSSASTARHSFRRFSG